MGGSYKAAGTKLQKKLQKKLRGSCKGSYKEAAMILEGWDVVWGVGLSHGEVLQGLS